MKQTKEALVYGRLWKGAAVLVAVCVFSAAAGADITWQKVTSGVTGDIYTISGTSLNNLYFAARGDTNICKYDSTAGTWGADTSWATHFAGNANWTGITSIDKVELSGSNIYVMAQDSNAIAGYFNGTSWADVSTGTTRVWTTLTANGTTLVAGSTTTRVTRIADGATGVAQRLDTTLGMSYITSVDYADGVFWAHDSKYKVAKSTDDGVTWSLVTDLPSDGVPYNYAIHALDADHVVIAPADGGMIYRTSDGGTTWQQVGDRFRDANARGIYADSWDSIWAYGSYDDEVWHWDGTDWTEYELPDAISGGKFCSMTCVDGVYWLGGSDGQLYTAVPEPATLVLLAGGGLVGLLRRKR